MEFLSRKENACRLVSAAQTSPPEINDWEAAWQKFLKDHADLVAELSQIK